MIARILLVALALALVLWIPFALKPADDFLAAADDTLVIISPHNEAIRYEFTRAFREHYRMATGRTVEIDWRLPGGTSEIARFLAGEYFAAFQRAWTETGRPWTPEVAAAFDSDKVALPADPAADTPDQAARRAFLASDIGVGIDLFFGGGAYDFIQQARAGRLVDSGLIRELPEVFSPDSIPEVVSGEPFYDSEGRWIGACVSAFGICYNPEVLRRTGFTELPAAWNDLADPRLFGEVALADPTKSGSAAKAFEMLIQQQMQIRLRELEAEQPDANPEERTRQAVEEGWLQGLRIIQRAGANSRYFTDSAGKVPIDVSQGEVAIGMCIDFYGRYQSEAVQIDDAPSRLQYFTPEGGSSVGADPIGLLRGAPNREVALAFMRFVLSIEGQKLWNFRVGTPGGPARYALRRLPIRKELYAPEYRPYRSDPRVDPFVEAESFTYRPEWTAPLFGVLRFLVKVICLDPEDEQRAAWKAIIAAGLPPDALRTFSDLSVVNYRQASGPIRDALRSSDRIEEVRLARVLGDHFRQQYREAEASARSTPQEPLR